MAMNRRRALLLAIFGSALASTLVIVFWPRQSGDPGIRLKIMRQDVERGNPVVFFQLQEPAGRRFQIQNVQWLIGDMVQDLYMAKCSSSSLRAGFALPCLDGATGQSG